MFDNVGLWIQDILGACYEVSRGPWEDHESLEFVAAVLGTGGPSIDVDDRRPRYRITLIGPRNKRSDASKIQEDMELVVQAILDGSKPCGSAHAKVISEPVGPGYTKDNRAWCSVDIQLIV